MREWLRETAVYNSRLQPTQMELRRLSGNTLLLGLDYGYGTTNRNNGNLMSQTIRIGTNPSINQSYDYDDLNRLKQATETINSVQQWQQTYDYDRFGVRQEARG